MLYQDNLCHKTLVIVFLFFFDTLLCNFKYRKTSFTLIIIFIQKQQHKKTWMVLDQWLHFNVSSILHGNLQSSPHLSQSIFSMKWDNGEVGVGEKTVWWRRGPDKEIYNNSDRIIVLYILHRQRILTGRSKPL